MSALWLSHSRLALLFAFAGRCSWCGFVLQTTVDSAEALLKKHEEFEGQVASQEERFRSLYNQADVLVQAGHYDSVK